MEKQLIMHFSTQCDRALFLDQHNKPLVIEHGEIIELVSWYENHWNQIAEALPVSIDGTTFTKRWQDRFDYHTLPQWRAKKLPHNLVVAYIYSALRKLYRGMNYDNRP